MEMDKVDVRVCAKSGTHIVRGITEAIVLEGWLYLKSSEKETKAVFKEWDSYEVRRQAEQVPS